MQEINAFGKHEERLGSMPVSKLAKTGDFNIQRQTTIHCLIPLVLWFGNFETQLLFVVMSGTVSQCHCDGMCTFRSSGGEFWQHISFPERGLDWETVQCQTSWDKEEEVQGSYTLESLRIYLSCRELIALPWQDLVH